MKKHNFWEGTWMLRGKDKDGNVLWEEELQNFLADEGEKQLLETYFRDENNPTQFFMRLCNDSLQETDTLADIQNEPVGNGYSPQTIERSSVGFPDLSLDAGDYVITSKTVTFTAVGGSIGPINTAYLATTSDNAGKLIGVVSLSVTRTIISGDGLEVYFKVKLK